jgi:hypothetical protein
MIILTNKGIYVIPKKPVITETKRLYRLHWFGYVKRMEENIIPKRVIYINWKQQDQEVDQEIDDRMK